MTEWITALLLMIGGIFALLAAVGIVRLPDLFMRMQAAAKGGSFGVGMLILAVAVYFGELGVTTRALLVIAFLFLTAPVAVHLIARAAYFVGVPLWKGTIKDELHGRYDQHTHALESRFDCSAATHSWSNLNNQADEEIE
jgi:multicomponent Na+:H+ antiporter subunit G